MPSVFSELSQFARNLPPEAAAALKRARNKERYRAAVERTWRNRPEVARFVLAHTNGIYIAKDERPRKGPDRHRDWWVFGIYLDDAAARTEVDAWQSVLLQALNAEGLSVDDLRFLPAKWDMRTRKLFPELSGDGADEAVVAAPWAARHREEEASRGLDIVKCAVCLVFEDTERAWALLEKVRGPTARAATSAAAARKATGSPCMWTTSRVSSVSSPSSAMPFATAPGVSGCAFAKLSCARPRRRLRIGAPFAARAGRSRWAAWMLGAVRMPSRTA